MNILSSVDTGISRPFLAFFLPSSVWGIRPFIPSSASASVVNAAPASIIAGADLIITYIGRDADNNTVPCTPTNMATNFTFTLDDTDVTALVWGCNGSLFMASFVPAPGEHHRLGMPGANQTVTVALDISPADRAVRSVSEVMAGKDFFATIDARTSAGAPVSCTGAAASTTFDIRMNDTKPSVKWHCSFGGFRTTGSSGRPYDPLTANITGFSAEPPTASSPMYIYVMCGGPDYLDFLLIRDGALNWTTVDRTISLVGWTRIVLPPIGKVTGLKLQTICQPKVAIGEIGFLNGSTEVPWFSGTGLLPAGFMPSANLMPFGPLDYADPFLATPQPPSTILQWVAFWQPIVAGRWTMTARSLDELDSVGTSSIVTVNPVPIFPPSGRVGLPLSIQIMSRDRWDNVVPCTPALLLTEGFGIRWDDVPDVTSVTWSCALDQDPAPVVGTMTPTPSMAGPHMVRPKMRDGSMIRTATLSIAYAAPQMSNLTASPSFVLGQPYTAIIEARDPAGNSIGCSPAFLQLHMLSIQWDGAAPWGGVSWACNTSVSPALFVATVTPVVAGVHRFTVSFSGEVDTLDLVVEGPLPEISALNSTARLLNTTQAGQPWYAIIQAKTSAGAEVGCSPSSAANTFDILWNGTAPRGISWKCTFGGYRSIYDYYQSMTVQGGYLRGPTSSSPLYAYMMWAPVYAGWKPSITVQLWDCSATPSLSQYTWGAPDPLVWTRREIVPPGGCVSKLVIDSDVFFGRMAFGELGFLDGTTEVPWFRGTGLLPDGIKLMSGPPDPPPKSSATPTANNNKLNAHHLAYNSFSDGSGTWDAFGPADWANPFAASLHPVNYTQQWIAGWIPTSGGDWEATARTIGGLEPMVINSSIVTVTPAKWRVAGQVVIEVVGRDQWNNTVPCTAALLLQERFDFQERFPVGPPATVLVTRFVPESNITAPNVAIAGQPYPVTITARDATGAVVSCDYDWDRAFVLLWDSSAPESLAWSCDYQQSPTRFVATLAPKVAGLHQVTANLAGSGDDILHPGLPPVRVLPGPPSAATSSLLLANTTVDSVNPILLAAQDAYHNLIPCNISITGTFRVLAGGQLPRNLTWSCWAGGWQFHSQIELAVGNTSTPPRAPLYVWVFLASGNGSNSGDELKITWRRSDGAAYEATWSAHYDCTTPSWRGALPPRGRWHRIVTTTLGQATISGLAMSLSLDGSAADAAVGPAGYLDPVTGAEVPWAGLLLAANSSTATSIDGLAMMHPLGNQTTGSTTSLFVATWIPLQAREKLTLTVAAGGTTITGSPGLITVGQGSLSAQTSPFLRPANVTAGAMYRLLIAGIDGHGNAVPCSSVPDPAGSLAVRWDGLPPAGIHWSCGGSNGGASSDLFQVSWPAVGQVGNHTVGVYFPDGTSAEWQVAVLLGSASSMESTITTLNSTMAGSAVSVTLSARDASGNPIPCVETTLSPPPFNIRWNGTVPADLTWACNGSSQFVATFTPRGASGDVWLDLSLASAPPANVTHQPIVVLPDTVPPQLTAVRFESSNSRDPALARRGDMLSVFFTASEPVRPATNITIGGLLAEELISIDAAGRQWVARRAANCTTEGPIGFAVSGVDDWAGNSMVVAVVDTVTVGPNTIRIDCTPPRPMNVTARSSNPVDPRLALPGDQLTLTFAVSEPIDTSTVGLFLATHPANITTVEALAQGAIYQATYVVLAGDALGEAQWLFNRMADLAGNEMVAPVVSGRLAYFGSTCLQDSHCGGLDGAKCAMNHSLLPAAVYHCECPEGSSGPHCETWNNSRLSLISDVSYTTPTTTISGQPSSVIVTARDAEGTPIGCNSASAGAAFTALWDGAVPADLRWSCNGSRFVATFTLGGNGTAGNHTLVVRCTTVGNVTATGQCGNSTCGVRLADDPARISPAQSDFVTPTTTSGSTNSSTGLNNTFPASQPYSITVTARDTAGNPIACDPATAGAAFSALWDGAAPADLRWSCNGSRFVATFTPTAGTHVLTISQHGVVGLRLVLEVAEVGPLMIIAFDPPSANANANPHNPNGHTNTNTNITRAHVNTTDPTFSEPLAGTALLLDQRGLPRRRRSGGNMRRHHLALSMQHP
ncbi:hypothetical protein PAPYR_7919 [Paratrimastix pyriformis]|uniref:EGF-like domain-containing protein n=1 Tax=Paratrimastix pyriformis TaxID=342808 RepID=A0ABQ8UBX0_9EUKA|nr:hypothetical protein PAPYR_7919 [Paratrimastix pyriformis]